MNLKEELSRLRKNKFHLETVHSQQQIEIVKLNERLRSYESEIDTKNQEIDVERGLNMRRGEEILYVEAENNKLRDQLREYFHNKDQYAADRMLSTESLTSLARERDQLSRQCSNYQSEIEKLNTQLATVTKKQAEQLLELENQIKNKGIPQTTTTSIRSSSIITKYGPDTRQSG